MTKEEKEFLESLSRPNDSEISKVFIRVNPALINCKDDRNRTPFMIAVSAKNHIMVGVLIEKGADISAHDREGNTVLHYAGRSGVTETIIALLKHHAPVLKLNDLGYSILHELAIAGHFEALNALREYLLPAVRSQLIHCCNKQDPADGKMAIHLAAMQKNPEVTKALLAFGADPNATQNHLYTPLHYAASRNYLDQTTLLLHEGAVALGQVNGKSEIVNQQSLIQAETKNKETVLQMARRFSAHAAADYLSTKTFFGMHRELVLKDGPIYSKASLSNNNNDDDESPTQILSNSIAEFIDKDPWNSNIKILREEHFDDLAKVCENPIAIIEQQSVETKRSSVMPTAMKNAFKSISSKPKLSSSSAEALAKEPALKKIKPILLALETCLLKSGLSSRVVGAINGLIQYYQKFCTDYKIGGKTRDYYYDQTYVYRDGNLVGVVSFSLIEQIFPFDDRDNIQSTASASLIDEGSHVVLRYKDLFFKYEPTAPSVEYAIDCFYRMLAPTSTTHNELLVFQRRGLVKTALISLAVNGQGFRKILDNHPQDLSPIDHDSFSAHAILHMLTLPADAKSDNFIATNYGTSAKPCYQLTDIDHDENFGNELVAVKGAKDESDHMTNVRSIIFLLPQMQLSVSPAISREFLHQTPEEWILRWVSQLLVKNLAYRSLINLNVLNSSQITELGIPLQLTPNTLVKLYRKIELIYSLLKAQQDIKLNDLLEKISPILYAYFQEIIKRATEEREAEYLLYRSDAIQDLMSTDQLNQKLQYEHKKLYDYQNRTENLQKAIEVWLGIVDLKVMEQDQQKRFYMAIEALPQQLEKLFFIGCTFLTDTILTKILHKQTTLTVLLLDQGHLITVDCLFRILNSNKELIVYLGDHNKLSAKDVCELFRAFNNRIKIYVNGKPYNIDETILHNTVKDATLNQLEWLILIDKTFYKDQARVRRDERGFGVVHRAFSDDQYNTLQRLQLLKAQQFDLTIADSDDRQVIYFAAKKGFIEIIDWLNGFEYSFKIVPERTNALHAAVTNKNLDLVKQVLKLRGYQQAINLLDETGKTALHLACGTGVISIVLFLIEAGANVDAASSYGYTPIMSAILSANEQLINIMIDKKADLSKKDPDGNSMVALAKKYNLSKQLVDALESQMPISKPEEEMSNRRMSFSK